MGIGAAAIMPTTLVGDHHLVPRRGTTQGDRRLGRRGRRRRRPRPVRQRHAARVLLVELVLRPERGARRCGARRHAARCARPRWTRRAARSTWSARLLSLVAVGGTVFGIIEGPERGWSDSLTVTGLVAGLVAARRVRLVGAARPRSRCSTRGCSRPRLQRRQPDHHGAVLRHLRPLLRGHPVPAVRGRSHPAAGGARPAADAAGADAAGAQRTAARTPGRLPPSWLRSAWA